MGANRINMDDLKDKEKALFLGLSEWLVLESGAEQRSRSAWLSFFLAHCVDDLSPKLSDELRRSFQIDHPSFIEGEVALCNIAADLHHTVTSRKISTKITRNVDWAKTMTKSYGDTLTRFVEKPRINQYHNQMLAALLRLGNDQLTVLESFDTNKGSLKARIRNLEHATKTIKKLLPKAFNRKQKFTKEIRYHLHTEYRHQAGNIILMLSFLHDLLDPELDSEAFKTFCNRVSSVFQAENSDHLLEVISRLAIAKEAHSQGFSITQLITKNSSSQKELTVFMKKNTGEELVIGKGRKLLESDDNDLIAQIRNCGKAMGDNPSGLEPDITIRYNNRFYMGDAKRNPSDDGRSYRASSIKTCASYLMEFEEKLAGSDPKFTLFFLQGGSKIADKTRDQIKQAEDFPDTDQLPIIGLGLDKDDFEGDIMKKWFCKIIS